MKRIIVSVTNDLVTDQRVHKTCTTLFNNGFDILLIGRKLKNSQPIIRNYNTLRIKLLFNKGFLFYAEYNLRLFFILLFSKKDILHSNDLDTLLPNFLVSKFLKKKLVYDSHELFTELPSLQGNYSKYIWKVLEKWLAPKQQNFITVSDSIALWFKQKYNTQPIVIKNFPNYSNTHFIETKNKYILYQGALNNGRGLLALIEAMQYIENLQLKIAGEGPFKSKIIKKIKTLKVEHKVQLLGNVHPAQLIPITQNATLGLSLEEDLGLSYRYSLPNKLFDYIQAKTPVVATYLPEIKTIISTYKIGEIIRSHSPEDIANAIKLVCDNGKTYYQKNLEKASKELIWENQESKLLSLFINA